MGGRDGRQRHSILGRGHPRVALTEAASGRLAALAEFRMGQSSLRGSSRLPSLPLDGCVGPSWRGAVAGGGAEVVLGTGWGGLEHGATLWLVARVVCWVLGLTVRRLTAELLAKWGKGSRAAFGSV